MEQPQTRYHGKVRVEIGLTTVEINVFDDNREKLYLEVQQAIAQFSHDIKPATAAQREITRAEQARAAAAAAAPTLVLKPTPTKTKVASPPECEECGLADMVELISWTVKGTGERKKAWKCQRCKKWIS